MNVEFCSYNVAFWTFTYRIIETIIRIREDEILYKNLAKDISTKIVWRYTPPKPTMNKELIFKE